MMEKTAQIPASKQEIPLKGSPQKKKTSKKPAKKILKKKSTPKLTAKQQQERRSQAARKAALARWSKERPPSKRALLEQLSKLPTSQLTVEHYADRPNPQLSWAAAILKRERSTPAQRREAAKIFSQSTPNRQSPWTNLPPEERSEIARRGGIRRWEIWREEQARLTGKKKT